MFWWLASTVRNPSEAHWFSRCNWLTISPLRMVRKGGRFWSTLLRHGCLNCSGSKSHTSSRVPFSFVWEKQNTRFTDSCFKCCRNDQMQMVRPSENEVPSTWSNTAVISLLGSNFIHFNCLIYWLAKIESDKRKRRITRQHKPGQSFSASFPLFIIINESFSFSSCFWPLHNLTRVMQSNTKEKGATVMHDVCIPLVKACANIKLSSRHFYLRYYIRNMLHIYLSLITLHNSLRRQISFLFFLEVLFGAQNGGSC